MLGTYRHVCQSKRTFPPKADGSDIVAKTKKLAELVDLGLLSKDEFETKKVIFFGKL